MEENKHLIYKTEGMISSASGNYNGTLALYDDRCTFYNDKCVFDDFEFDICKAEIIQDSCEVSFLDLYKKEKEYVQIRFAGNKSLRYFLSSARLELFIGRFEQRKVEKQNYRIVLKAFACGYSGEVDNNTNGNSLPSPDQNAVPTGNVKARQLSDLNTWRDLLTPHPWRDYYHSLNASGKKVYDTILAGIVECKEHVRIEGIKLTNETVGVIYHYILWDNPAIFCIGEYAMWRALCNDGKTVKITSLCGGKADEESLRNSVLLGVKKALSHPDLYRWSDIQKEKYVHDYMIRNWTYDETLGNGGSRLEPYTVYGAFCQKTAVCEGFAKSAKLLLDILGVHTLVLSGEVKSASAGHSWNVVKINSLAYHLDITFDMGQTGGKNYAIRYDYFNVPDSDLTDRVWQNPEVVWRCNTQNYTYPSIVGGLISEKKQLSNYISKEVCKRKAYMYVKLEEKILSGISNPVSWIAQEFNLVKQGLKSKSRATVLTTDICGLFVIAVNYH